MLKLIINVRRNHQLKPAAFRKHLEDHHGALLKACPAAHKYLHRYVQNFNLEAANEVHAGGAPFDAVVELWFESRMHLDQFFADPDYLATLRPDEPRFADLESCVFMLTEEKQVFPEAVADD